MKAKLIDFNKDEAAQELLGYGGLTEGYEEVIERVSLNILRQSVSDSIIESIKFVRSAGSHPRFKVGGTQVEDDPDKIILQELYFPFDLEILIRSGASRHLLKTTFIFDCSKMDTEQKRDHHLEIHGQQEA